MKLEKKDIVDALTPFINGCSFRATLSNKGMTIGIGCYHLTNLMTGSDKYLQEIIDSTEKREIPLSDIPLTEAYQEIEYAILSMREQCTWCGGTRHIKG